MFHQSGLECQTLCHFNGIQAVRGERALLGLDTAQIRAQAKEKGSHKLRLDYSVEATGQVLVEMGIIKFVDISTGNPIKGTEKLFSGNRRYLAVLKAQGWHAFCILPIKGASEERFVLKVDSMGGKQEYLSVDRFIDLLLDQGQLDGHFILEVK